MHRTYIAGPISGLPEQPLEVKIARFRTAEAHFIELGHEVVNPLDVEMSTCDGLCNPDRHIGQDGVPTHSWECFMRHDLMALLTCDGIAFLPGWRESRGARLEIEIATALKMREYPCDFTGLPYPPIKKESQ